MPSSLPMGCAPGGAEVDDRQPPVAERRRRRLGAIQVPSSSGPRWRIASRMALEQRRVDRPAVAVRRRRRCRTSGGRAPRRVAQDRLEALDPRACAPVGRRGGAAGQAELARAGPGRRRARATASASAAGSSGGDGHAGAELAHQRRRLAGGRHHQRAGRPRARRRAWRARSPRARDGRRAARAARGSRRSNAPTAATGTCGSTRHGGEPLAHDPLAQRRGQRAVADEHAADAGGRQRRRGVEHDVQALGDARGCRRSRPRRAPSGGSRPRARPAARRARRWAGGRATGRPATRSTWRAERPRRARDRGGVR